MEAVSAVSAVCGLAMNFKDLVRTVHSIASQLRSHEEQMQERKEELYVMTRLGPDNTEVNNDGLRWWLQDAINDVLELQPSQKEKLLPELREKWKLGLQVPQSRNPQESSNYQDLSRPLKRCFAFCSIFPAKWRFEREKLVRMWVAQGFIHESDGSGSTSTSDRKEDVAKEYFDHLVELSLFHKVQHPVLQDRYEIDDEIHLKLRQVVQDYYQIIDGPLKADEIPPTVRHLSVTTDCVHQLKTYPAAWLKKLRTLLVFNSVNHDGAASSSTSRPIDEKVLKVFKGVRILDLSDAGITDLAKSTSVLSNVRYLALPKTIKVLAGIERMEKLAWADIAVEGRRMKELEKLNSLRGTLSIKDLDKVRSRTDANKACLSEKKHLEVLKLEWKSRGPQEAEKSGDTDSKILNCLQPHANLKKLHITFYAGKESPDWLANAGLMENLSSLYLKDCRQMETLPPVGELPLLKILSVDELHAVEVIDRTFCPATGLFTELETLVLHYMKKLATWDTDPAHGGDDSRIPILFPKLKNVKIMNCPELTSFRGLLYCRESLSNLQVKECPKVKATFSRSRFPNLTPQNLHIQDCPNLMQFKE